MNRVLKFIVGIFIGLFLIVGLVPDVNTYLHSFMTFDQYWYMLLGIIIINFMICLHLNYGVKINRNFKLMDESLEFKKYKKETKYEEDKNFYYRDLPFNKNLFRVFWIAYQYGIIKNRASILNALLLKWCNEGRIRFVNNAKYEILDTNKMFDDINEEDLFNVLKHYKKNRFVKLTMFNYKTIFKEIDDILLLESRKLKAEKKIISYQNEDIIGSNIKEDVDIVFGFRNFLLNFGNISDKSSLEVVLWDEYLIYAELLGISDRVKREFRKANIDYSSREVRFKKINKRWQFAARILLCYSYLTYLIIFLVYTGIIWYGYAWFTWYYGIDYLIHLVSK